MRFLQWIRATISLATEQSESLLGRRTKSGEQSAHHPLCIASIYWPRESRNHPAGTKKSWTSAADSTSLRGGVCNRLIMNAQQKAYAFFYSKLACFQFFTIWRYLLIGREMFTLFTLGWNRSKLLKNTLNGVKTHKLDCVISFNAV
jgi:hypothetical protein